MVYTESSKTVIAARKNAVSKAKPNQTNNINNYLSLQRRNNAAKQMKILDGSV